MPRLVKEKTFPYDIGDEAEPVDLTETLLGNREAGHCLLFQIQGDAAEIISIFDGDWIILNTHNAPKIGDLVLKRDGEDNSIKRCDAGDLPETSRGLYLVSSDGKACDRPTRQKRSSKILGVVAWVIHQPGSAQEALAWDGRNKNKEQK
jgi:SOS-response transcriptional repressor LexA